MNRLYVDTITAKYDCAVVDAVCNECYMISMVGEDKHIKKISKDLRKKMSIALENARDDNYDYRGERAYIKLSPSYDKSYRKMPRSSVAQLALIKRDDFCESTKELTCVLLTKDTEELQSLVFDKLYKNTAVPILEEWMSYIVPSMINSMAIRRISVLDGNYGDSEEDHPDFQAYLLKITQDSLLNIIQEGIRNNLISVCENKEVSDLMNMTNGLDNYLNLYGDVLARRIQESFVPKFDPDVDDFTDPVHNYDDSCFHNGVELYKGQKVALQASVNCLEKEDAVFVIGEMGIGEYLPS